MMILAGAGVGGGSLDYANTLYEPLDAFYRDRSGRTSPTGRPSSRRTTTRPSGCSASSTNPRRPRRRGDADRSPTRWAWATPSTRPRSASSSAGPTRRPRASEVEPTRTSAAPGPTRNACIECGECMTGCRHSAKNTLIKNYLHLAEQAGAVVHPLTTVTARPAPRGRRLRGRRPGGPRPSCRAGAAHQDASPPTRWSSPRRRSAPRSCCTGCKDEGDLPRHLRPARRADPDQLRGAPRRASRRTTRRRLQPGRRDHLVVPPRRRHPHRAGPLRQGHQRDGAAADRAHRRRRAGPRWRTWLTELWRAARRAVRRRSTTCKHWSERTVIALVMQTLDNSITTVHASAPASAGGC